MAIQFFSEDLQFKLKHPRKTSFWIKSVLKKEKRNLGDVNYIFCKDSYLLAINKEYLNHNALTDIITFDTSEKDKSALISGDIFISVERVEDNAKSLQLPFEEELHRVIIHGILHLLGYNDKKQTEKAQMRKKEEAYLSLRK